MQLQATIKKWHAYPTISDWIGVMTLQTILNLIMHTLYKRTEGVP
jgi:hypothetical protein